MDTNQHNQDNNYQINSFIKGMNSDTSYDMLNAEQYLFGQNIRITSNALVSKTSDSNSVENIVTPVPFGKPINVWHHEWGEDLNYKKILAAKTIENIGVLITKQHDDTWNVYKIELRDNTLAHILIFKSTYTTDKDTFSIVLLKETQDVFKVYIADGIHEILTLDINRSYLNGYTEEDLALNQVFPVEQVQIDQQVSGQLRTQQVQYTYRLYQKHGHFSKLAPVTRKIQVINNNRSAEVGNAQDTITNVGFRLKIDYSKYKKLFNKIQIFRLSYIIPGQNPQITLIADNKLEDADGIHYYTDQGNQSLKTYTMDEFAAISGVAYVPQVIESNQNYLFSANVKDTSVINIPITEFDARAFSFNKDGKIKLYNDITCTSVREFDTIEQAASQSSHEFNRYTDPNIKILLYDKEGILTHEHSPKVMLMDEACMYKGPESITYIGGKGKNVEWELVEQLIPIDYSGNIGAASIPTQKYDNVMRVFFKDALDLDIPSESCKISEYLKQCGVSDNNHKWSYNDNIISSLCRSLRRDEVYRYGIVLYDKFGHRTNVQWIADIRIPSEYIIGTVEQKDGVIYAKSVGVRFTVNLRDLKDKYNIVGYEIVRCEKSFDYSKTLFQAALSRPLRQSRFQTKKTSENYMTATYRTPWYPNMLLSTQFTYIRYTRLDNVSWDGIDRKSVIDKDQIEYYRRIGVIPIPLFEQYPDYAGNNVENIYLYQAFSPEITFRQNDYLNITKRFECRLTPVSYNNILQSNINNAINGSALPLRFTDGGMYEAEQTTTPTINDITNDLLEHGFDYFEQRREDDGSGQYTKMYYTMIPWYATYATSNNTKVYDNSKYGKGIYVGGSTDKSRHTVELFINDFNKNFSEIRKILGSDKVDQYIQITQDYIKAHCQTYTYKWFIKDSSSSQSPSTQLFRADQKKVTPSGYIHPINLGIYLWYKVHACSYSGEGDHKSQLHSIIRSYSLQRIDEMNDKNSQSGTNNSVQSCAIDDVYIKDVALPKHPTWHDGYNNIQYQGAKISTGNKQYTSYITTVGDQQYVNWVCNGMYDIPISLDDANSRYNEGNEEPYGPLRYNELQDMHIYRHYNEEGTDVCYQTTYAHGATGPGPQCMLISVNPNSVKYAHRNVLQTTLYTGKLSYGTIYANVTHDCKLYSGSTKEERRYDIYYGFGNFNSKLDKPLYVFDGDIYITPAEFTTLYKTYDFNSKGDSLMSNQITYYLPMESKINNFFDYGMNMLNNQSANLMLEAGAIDGICTQSRPQHQYNMIYSDNNTSNNIFSSLDIEDSQNTYNNRIVYSQKKTNGEDIDNWGIFKAADFIDTETQYGQVSHLMTHRDILYCWQSKAFGKLSVNERSLVSDKNNNTIQLGQGAVLQRIDYLDTNHGMQIDQNCAVSAENAVFWIDILNNAIMACQGDQVYDLGERTNVQNIINQYKSNRNNVTIHYDLQNQELLCNFLKKDEKDAQLVFNTKLGVATSVYTRVYDDIIKFDNKLVGLVTVGDDNSFAAQLQMVIGSNMREFDGLSGVKAVQYNYIDNTKYYLLPTVLQFVVNASPSQTKTFDNQKIVSLKRAYDKDFAANFLVDKVFKFETDLGTSTVGKIKEERITDREGNICYTIPRENTTINQVPLYGRRLRGKWMNVTITDNNPKYDYSISHIITKFRQSYS